MANEGKGPGFFTGLFLGAFAGALIGFLLASESTKEARARWKVKADEILTKAKGGARAFMEEAEEALREAVEEGREASARAKAELEARFEEARGKRDELEL